MDPDYLDTALNEWDACATEEAIQIRERLGEGEVVVVTVGDEDSEAALRRCLAMGADRAIRVDGTPVDPVSTARALAGVVAAESPDLVLAGVQSSDSVQGSTGVALAELVDLPRVAVVTKVDWSGSGPATVDRELEGGLVDVVEVDTPALLTIQTGINQPRYANLRAIKQAEQVEIAVVPAETGEPGYRVWRMFTPPRGEGAELLNGSTAQVAQRIVEIVRERLA
ncbi:MAG TPA: electron transfer flavoprotein subunit beta/FixA family protein [Gaiellaceae bacterium]|nr:electron transfer flavoprotein subunit beta/FixA family protein [Gaiellaceae bacterium]